jgi:adenosine deaminase
MDWVCTSAAKAAEEFGIQVRLIASVNRHESPELAEQVAWLAAAHIDDGIVGIDLAGNEAEFSAEPFAPIFAEAKQAGLCLTIHAGEWAGAENVREAIEKVGADRIGHGVRVMEDENVVALARERGTAFEVCVTSNYQSGVVPALTNHPLPRMLQADLNVTLNTDDPSVSRIDLTHEFKLVHEDLGIPMNILKRSILAAAKAAFLPDNERQALHDKLEEKLGLKLWKDE